MSDARLSALPGARSEGLVEIREMGLQGMITLRADLAGAAKAVSKVTGAPMPAPRAISAGTDCHVAWMSPDELLILCAHADAARLARALTDALSTHHALVVDVSDARAVFAVAGPAGALRDVLSKITPADIGALAPGEMRRTRLQQVAGALWFESETEARLICFRSVARYVFDLLSVSAHPGGAVGHH